VFLRKSVDFKPDEQQFLPVQFINRKSFGFQFAFYACASEIMVQVDDIVKFLRLQFVEKLAKVIIQNMHFINVRIGIQYWGELLLCYKMDFGVFNLIFKTPDNQRC
jgi:hypothetical protein